jgi:hypothetical protein
MMISATSIHGAHLRYQSNNLLASHGKDQCEQQEEPCRYQ